MVQSTSTFSWDGEEIKPAPKPVYGGLPMVDYHEPAVMKQLLGQVGFLPGNLNDEGWADYRWYMHDGNKLHHVERKTWGELSDLDRVEQQIWRHLTKNPEAKLTWVLEGIVTPTAKGYVLYKEAPSKGRMLFVPVTGQNIPLKMLHSWLYQIGKFVEVHYTSCVVDTANLLVAMYQADQKPEAEHTTLARYYKTVTWHPNPQVAKLMAVGDGIGPARAEALIERFGTLYNVLTAKVDKVAAVPGMGMTTAKRLLQRIGRTDV